MLYRQQHFSRSKSATVTFSALLLNAKGWLFCGMQPTPIINLFVLVTFCCCPADYEFLCHLSVSLLEPAAGSSSSSSADGTAAASAGGSSSSKLRGLWGGAGRQQEETAGPSLTSRYIRVVNTYDIVPHSECLCYAQLAKLVNAFGLGRTLTVCSACAATYLACADMS